MIASAEGTFAKNAAERLRLILRGRRPYTWAQSVGLSTGAIKRLLIGSFPDPEKLVPTCRVENLSLTWWLDGIGAPYLVYTPVDTADAIRHLKLLIDEEPDWKALLIESQVPGDGWTPVLYQPAMVRTHEGKDVPYTAVQVVGGVHRSLEVVDLLSTIDARIAPVSTADLRRAATGYMSATEMFGNADSTGLLAQSEPFVLQLSRDEVREQAATWRSPREMAETEATQTLRHLDDDTFDTVVRMLRGLTD